MPGKFIVIEGTDGSGKATQTELLVRRLKDHSHNVSEISFPRYGERSAAMVEDYLNGLFGSAEEVGPHRGSIFFAADRYAASPTIRAWLDAGNIVIANRYVGSNMGHQGGKMQSPEERQKFFEWNYELEFNIFGIPKPDLNILLHVPADIAQQLVDKKAAREYLHGKKRDIHEDSINHLRAAESAYLHIAATFPDFRLISCVENNELLPIETIHEKIWLLVQQELS